MRRYLVLYSVLVLSLFALTTAFNVYSNIANANAKALNPSYQDVSPPQLVLDSPANGSKVTSDFILRVNITDDTGVSAVTYSVNSGTYYAMTAGSSGIYNATVEVSNLAVGVHFISVNATDAASNEGSIWFSIYLERVGIPEADVYAYSLTGIDAPVIDGTIDAVWEQVTKLGLPEFGDGGYIKFLQDGTSIFSLLVFDSSLAWVAIQWGGEAGRDECMKDSDDMWWYSDGSSAMDFTCSASFSISVSPDQSDDINFSATSEGNMKVVELQRPLVTVDASDTKMILGESQTFIVASNDNHKEDRTEYSFALTTEIPTGDLGKAAEASDDEIEFTDLILVLSLTATIATIAIHMVMRVFIRPIKHEKRIIYLDEADDSAGRKETVPE